MNPAPKAVSFLPKPLLSWIAEGRKEVRFPAVVAFADVSGFTLMTERLAGIGREGAETLTSILNRYFTEMIDRIERVGGFVGKFGGDAMTIFFPATDAAQLPSVAKRAVAGAIELQKAMTDFREVQTKAGVFSLGMKIGIAGGEVLFRVVGNEQLGRQYLLA
ncbi:MAG: adenylate/guanylate cyclase domain-containing protein, partial [Calditrichota bacterium]